MSEVLETVRIPPGWGVWELKVGLRGGRGTHF